jgi:hypothetical protein
LSQLAHRLLTRQTEPGLARFFSAWHSSDFSDKAPTALVC